MWYDNPRLIDACVYDLVLSEYPRGQNRARIQNLANGAPPYTDKEVEENNIVVNVSDLTHTRLCHDARSQFYNGFLKTGYFARATTDQGPVHKRDSYSAIVTKNWNRCMKRSIRYYERLRAEFGMLVLHGISPGIWENEEAWCPKPLGVEDVLLPGETVLGFDNLPFIVLRRSFTGIELMKLTAEAKKDSGWNMPFVKRILKWMEQQATVLRSLNWPDVWAPEKIAERTKEEAGGTLAGDRAPRIDVFDIYAYDDRKGREGWVRRMILDSWSEPQLKEGNYTANRKEGVAGDTNGFLFTSGERRVADNWQNVISFQFADLSAVFPARYHSVRSLGWILYAACHLGNRLRCKFYESVLEALNMLFEVDSAQDAQNALKLNLVNKGFIDKTIRPVKAQDRWQVNANLVELGIRDNQQVINENSAAWVQNQNFSRDRTEKTRFQVMAELQAMTSLAGAALQQCYQYQVWEFREIFRRFFKVNSSDPDVRSFRARCLTDGVPEKYLKDANAWDIESEQMVGAGNKTLAMTIAQQLMEWQGKFDPEPQRQILRDAVLAITDDAGKAEALVPESPVKVTNAVHDAELTAASLLAGIPVQVQTGINHLETIETLMNILDFKVQTGLQSGGMVSPPELQGLNLIAQHIGQHLQILAQDKDERQRVREIAGRLTKLTNELKGFQQRYQQAMQKQAQAAAEGNGGMDPKDKAKIEATLLTARAKVQLGKESHAQKTAQRAIAFEQKLAQDQKKHAADVAATDLEAATKIRRNRLSSLSED